MLKLIKTTNKKIETIGYCELFQCEAKYKFSNSITIDAAESYVDHMLNVLSDGTKNDLYKVLCEYRDNIMDCDKENYIPIGQWNPVWKNAVGQDILCGIKPKSISIYRNPYDDSDKVLGASFYCDCAWDEEHEVEILFRGNQIVDVTEFLGYGEFGIWDEDDM